MNELSLIQTVSEYLDHRSFHIVTELPFLQRHIDIVGYEPTKGALIAVEAKIKNWQIAVKQAVTCLLFADEVYIAMPTQYIHRVSHVEIARFGIGLLGVNGSVEIVHQAILSRYASNHYREKAIDQFHRLEALQFKGRYDG